MKRLNNKILLVVLLVLTGIFILSKVFRSPKRESNFGDALAGIDTAKVTDIRVYPLVENGSEIKLTKTDRGWQASNGTREAAAETSSVNSLLASLANVRVSRLAATGKNKWNDFSVNDSSATHVVVFNRQEKLAEWWIGRSSYQQGGGATYVRSAENENVYAVEGNLSYAFNRPFSDWRDKTFITIKKDSVDKISFQYPGDSSFVLEKKDNVWMIGTEKADSAQVVMYLNSLQSKSLSAFADDFSPAGSPDVQLSFSGNGKTLAVQAWKRDNDWALTSSHQQGTYFAADSASIRNDLLKGKTAFTGK